MADLGVLARLTQQASDNIFREHNFRSSLFAQARQELQQDRQLRLQESNAMANRMSQADQLVEKRRQTDLLNQYRAAQLKEQTAYHDARIKAGFGRGGSGSLSPIVSANTGLFNIQKAKAAELQAVAEMEQTNLRRASLGLPPRPMPPTTDFSEMESNLRAIAGSAGTAGGGQQAPAPVARPVAAPYRESIPTGPLPEGGKLEPLLNPDTTARVPQQATSLQPNGAVDIPDDDLPTGEGVEQSIPLFPGGQQATAPLRAPGVGFRPPQGDSAPPPSIGPSEAARLKRRGITPEQAAAEQARQVALAAQRSQESMASVFKSADVLAADPTEKPVPIKTQKGTVLAFREDDPSAYERNKDYIDTLESKILPLAEMIEVEKDEQTRIEIQGRIDKIKHVAGKLRERAPKPEKEKATRTPSEGDVGLIMAIQKFNKANKIKSPSDYKDLDAPLDPGDVTGEGPSIGDAYKALRIRGVTPDELKALDPVKPAAASGGGVPSADTTPTATGQPERKQSNLRELFRRRK